jgi:stage II sporulation SpoAA-like protein
MIEALKGFPENTVAFAARGQLTQSDYRAVVVPAVETALKTHKKLRIYFEIGSDFAGIDPGAVWEDFKIGVAHWLRWERVAVVTDIGWTRNAVWPLGFLIPAKLKVFPTAQAAQGRSWLASG